MFETPRITAEKREIAALQEELEELRGKLAEALQDAGQAEALQRRASALAQELRLVKQASGSTETDVVALRKALGAAKAALIEQDEILQQLAQPPLAYAIAVGVNLQDYSDIEGKEARVITHRFGEEYFGKTGKVVSKKPRRAEGDVIVEFAGANGRPERKWLGVGIPGTIIPAKEITFIDPLPGGNVVLFHDNKFMEVKMPPGLKVEIGDTVKISLETLAIVGVVGRPLLGDVSTVIQAVGDSACEVEMQETKRVVQVGAFAGRIEKGDRVLLDPSASVIVHNLGKEEERFVLSEIPNVAWNQIGGLDSAKRELREAIELPYARPELFSHYRKGRIKGVLLYGPPGCGKTLLVKATATAIARLHNGGNPVASGFLYIKGPEILTRWVGDAEGAIRVLFLRARKHKEKHGYPAVIFIDECEALMRKRGTGISSDIEATIVPAFLSEMDGLDDNGAIVILATNRQDILDPAVVREGRIDRKIRVTRPNLESTLSIFNIHLAEIPVAADESLELLAQLGTQELFSEKYGLYDVAVKEPGATESVRRRFGLSNIISGAMVANVVDMATSNAIRRDIKANQATGLTQADVLRAVQQTFMQQFDINHADALDEFCDGFRNRVQGITRLRQAS